ncbi:MAG: DUF4126 domain-containing protein [Verrucomicrobiaceae bacterium]|nr:MAG: DUF4126 domain-containing protein [Verrucomicrobiaceae bacterium]
MPIPSLLSLALGMSFMAGLNLYLTTFLAGLAVRLGWGDTALHPALEIMGHPALIITAGVLFLLELVVDKIPWLDTVWDMVHTVVRPAGAVLLTLAVMTGSGPVLTTVAAVLGAGMALSTHLTKSGVRLILNASPEPFSNILASLAEDALVAGLLLLSLYFPHTGLAVCLVMLAGIWLMMPKIFRLVKASVYLLWKKFRAGNPAAQPADLSAALTAHQRQQLTDVLGPDAGFVRTAWAVRCISGKSRGFDRLRANVFGTLVSPADQPGTLVFLPRRWLRRAPVRLSLPGCGIGHESVFLSENLVIHNPAERLLATFRFPRGQAALAARLEADLRNRLGLTPPVPVPLPPPALGAGAEPGIRSPLSAGM